MNFPESTFRNRLKRGSEALARYPTEHEKSIPDRPLRCRVVLPRTSSVRPKATGHHKMHGTREILNAVFYIVRGGCTWRLLPHDFTTGWFILRTSPKESCKEVAPLQAFQPLSKSACFP